MKRRLNFSIGEYYHIYSRGVNKQKIYLNTKDYNRFVALLYVCNSTEIVDLSRHFNNGHSFEEIFKLRRKNTLVDIGSYCLMSNHFHLLLKEKTEGGILKFMRKVLTAYSMYFNKKNDRVGPLFQSRFKSKHINSDSYLDCVVAYIYLNPLKIIEPKWKEKGVKNIFRAKKFLADYHARTDLTCYSPFVLTDAFLNEYNRNEKGEIFKILKDKKIQNYDF